jgi:Uncharacterised protein family (UPF0158)
MTTLVSLDELIDALEAQSETLFAFLDRETGETVVISEETLSLGEAETDALDSLQDWQKEEAELARNIQGSDRYLELPSQFEVNEWNIMADFCDQIERNDTRATFLRSIRGSHVFRRFKDQLTNFGLWDEWHRFRRHAFGEIMREWCEENGITLAAPQNQPLRR